MVLISEIFILFCFFMVILCRYGKIFRGLKVWQAQLHEMKGVIIYSDPADDGSKKGELYPNGPFRPVDAVQRGSSQYISLYSGDPLTPNVAAKKGIKAQFTPESAPNIPTIPVLPVSAANAKHFISALKGFPIPSDDSQWEGWIGGLDIPYHIGSDMSGNEVFVHMNIKMNNTLNEIWNVIGKIDGVETDRSILIGNHRDAVNTTIYISDILYCFLFDTRIEIFFI
jgi:N-acetylated-alpha-linked acidic dipeptidase